jgi:hypothetical protein
MFVPASSPLRCRSDLSVPGSDGGHHGNVLPTTGETGKDTGSWTGGTVLGGVGAAIGVVSFGFTVYAWRAERRERREADAAEREARLTEIAIERERLDAEQRERERQHHADITTFQLPHKRTRDGERIYKFKLRNMGPGYSKHVVAVLQTKDGRVLGGLPFGIPLERGQEHPFDVPVPKELWDGKRPPLEVVVQWRNDRGQRELETSNLEFSYDV